MTENIMKMEEIKNMESEDMEIMEAAKGYEKQREYAELSQKMTKELVDRQNETKMHMIVRKYCELYQKSPLMALGAAYTAGVGIGLVVRGIGKLCSMGRHRR